MSKEAMKLALEALEGCEDVTADVLKAITAIREALASEAKEQPAQQEPVVFYRCNGCGHAYEQVHPTSCDCMEDGGFDRVEYYTSPPAQKKSAAWTLLLTGEHHGLVGKAGEKFVGAPEYYERVDVYTSLPAQPSKPLTDEQLYQVFPAIATYTEANKTLYRSIARAIEAAHGIKENT